jgi:hypothetical protein
VPCQAVTASVFGAMSENAGMAHRIEAWLVEDPIDGNQQFLASRFMFQGNVSKLVNAGGHVQLPLHLVGGRGDGCRRCCCER